LVLGAEYVGVYTAPLFLELPELLELLELLEALEEPVPIISLVPL